MTIVRSTSELAPTVPAAAAVALDACEHVAVTVPPIVTTDDLTQLDKKDRLLDDVFSAKGEEEDGRPLEL